jgi:hypothetical protein
MERNKRIHYYNREEFVQKYKMQTKEVGKTNKNLKKKLPLEHLVYINTTFEATAGLLGQRRELESFRIIINKKPMDRFDI